MSRRCVWVITATLIAAWAVGAVASEEASPLSIAVVTFVGDGTQPATAPEVATRLAERIGAQEPGGIIGPSEAGAALGPAVQTDQIRQRAESLGVDALIVGSSDPSADGIQIDFWLHRADSGAAVATYRAEATSLDQLERTLERLAREVVVAARSALGPPRLPAVSAQGKDEDATEGAESSDAPISITSEEMEAYQSEGTRRFVFLRNVRVIRDDVTLTSDRLEAFYPEGSKQPDRLIATGHVRLSQRERRARCDEATYLRAEDRIVCRGSAELRQGCDWVRGSVIELDLAEERMVVNGSASAILYPQGDGDGGCQEPSS